MQTFHQTDLLTILTAPQVSRVFFLRHILTHRAVDGIDPQGLTMADLSNRIYKLITIIYELGKDLYSKPILFWVYKCL